MGLPNWSKQLAFRVLGTINGKQRANGFNDQIVTEKLLKFYPTCTDFEAKMYDVVRAIDTFSECLGVENKAILTVLLRNWTRNLICMVRNGLKVVLQVCFWPPTLVEVEVPVITGPKLKLSPSDPRIHKIVPK